MITYPLNNILYSAEDAELFHCTRTSGVFSADDEFSVSVTGADNTVVIGPGIAWIRNARFSGKVAANKTSVSLDMGLADGSYPRIDAVVIQFDANANQTSIVVKQGVAASSPTPPEVVRTEAVYELHLYHVRRGAGAAVVSASDITDLRQDRNYCGVMMDDVTNIDENKFLAKTAYDPSGSVESAGGIAKYVAENAPKTTVVDSVTSTSKTDAASAASVKKTYDLAKTASGIVEYIPVSVTANLNNEGYTVSVPNTISAVRIDKSVFLYGNFSVPGAATAESVSLRIVMQSDVFKGLPDSYTGHNAVIGDAFRGTWKVSSGSASSSVRLDGPIEKLSGEYSDLLYGTSLTAFVKLS